MGQLCTIAQAQVLEAEINASGIGKGVKEIYIPEWSPAPNGPASPGTTADLKPYTIRFNNGTEGFNCGIIKAFQKMFPFSWLNNLAAEVNNQYMYLNQ